MYHIPAISNVFLHVWICASLLARETRNIFLQSSNCFKVQLNLYEADRYFLQNFQCLFTCFVRCANARAKGPFLYYVRVKGWVGGIAKYLVFLTEVGGWF